MDGKVPLAVVGNRMAVHWACTLCVALTCGCRGGFCSNYTSSRRELVCPPRAVQTRLGAKRCKQSKAPNLPSGIDDERQCMILVLCVMSFISVLLLAA